MLLLKVHKGNLIRSYVHMAIQNISVPYIILPFRILYYFRSVPFRSVKYTPPLHFTNGICFIVFIGHQATNSLNPVDFAASNVLV